MFQEQNEMERKFLAKKFKYFGVYLVIMVTLLSTNFFGQSSEKKLFLVIRH